jgi:hypothetical protein
MYTTAIYTIDPTYKAINIVVDKNMLCVGDHRREIGVKNQWSVYG